MILARDCASKSLRPAVNKIPSTILLITRSHCNDCIAAPGAGPVNYRVLIQRNLARCETAFRDHFTRKSCAETGFSRVVMMNRSATGNVKTSFCTGPAASNLWARAWLVFAEINQALCETSDRVRSTRGCVDLLQGHDRRCPLKSR